MEIFSSFPRWFLVRFVLEFRNEVAVRLIPLSTPVPPSF
eukprot:UN3359